MEWTAADLAAREAQEQQKAVVEAKAAPLPPQKPKTPDLPPYVEKCVRYGLALQRQRQAAQKAKTAPEEAASKPSADELVLQEIQTADERQKCAQAVLNYYRSIQKTNQKAVAKTS